MIKPRRLRWADHVPRIEEGRRPSKILTNKPTENRPLQGPKRIWENNIRMDLNKIDITTRNYYECDIETPGPINMDLVS